MKRQNVRTLSLIVVTFTYLLLGAAVFDALESEFEGQEDHRLREMADQLRRKYNMSDEDFDEITQLGIHMKPYKAGTQWKFAGAFYFATTVITTIGYGHSTPKTTEGKIFCMCYAVPGIPLCLIMFQSIGERMNTIITWILRQLKKLLSCRDRSVSQTNLMLVSFTTGSTVLSIGAAVFSRYENWGYLDSFYYCFITLTTIGFGDFVALQRNDSLAKRPDYVAFSLIFILFGLTVVSSVMNLLVLRFLTMNTEDERRDQMEAAAQAQELRRLRGDVIWVDQSNVSNIGPKKHNWSSYPPLPHSPQAETPPFPKSVYPSSPCDDSSSFLGNPGSHDFEAYNPGLKIPDRSLRTTFSSWLTPSGSAISVQNKSLPTESSKSNSPDGATLKNRYKRHIFYPRDTRACFETKDAPYLCPISAQNCLTTNNVCKSGLQNEYVDGRIPFMTFNDPRESGVNHLPSVSPVIRSSNLDDMNPILSGNITGAPLISAHSELGYGRHPRCYVHGEVSCNSQNTTAGNQICYVVMHRPNLLDSWYDSVNSIAGTDSAVAGGPDCCCWWHQGQKHPKTGPDFLNSSTITTENSTVSTNTNTSSILAAEDASVMMTNDNHEGSAFHHSCPDGIDIDVDVKHHNKERGVLTESSSVHEPHVPNSTRTHPLCELRSETALPRIRPLFIAASMDKDEVSVNPGTVNNVFNSGTISDQYLQNASYRSGRNTSPTLETSRPNRLSI